MLTRNIRKRVLATIESRIQAGQTLFNQGVQEIDTDTVEQMRLVAETAKTKRVELEEKCVKDVFAGLI